MIGGLFYDNKNCGIGIATTRRNTYLIATRNGHDGNYYKELAKKYKLLREYKKIRFFMPGEYTGVKFPTNFIEFLKSKHCLQQYMINVVNNYSVDQIQNLMTSNSPHLIPTFMKQTQFNGFGSGGFWQNIFFIWTGATKDEQFEKPYADESPDISLVSIEDVSPRIITPPKRRKITLRGNIEKHNLRI